MIQTRRRPLTAPALARVIGDHRSPTPGPTLVIIGGLHANEHAGIEAAQRVHNTITSGGAPMRRGRVIALRGNLAALAEAHETPHDRRRYIDEDLNRAFVPGNDSNESRSVEQAERAELDAAFDAISAQSQGPVYLLDLHTFSSESPPFIVLEDALPTRRFAAAFPLPKVLGLEEELQGLLIDDVTTRRGFVSCIVEAGQHEDTRAIDIHEAIVLIALETLGIVDHGAEASLGERPFEVADRAAGYWARRFYDVRQRVGITHESFRMDESAKALMPVRARRTIIAHERAHPMVAETGGVLFLPNRQADRGPGDDAFFIIQRVGSIWLGLSAVLRNIEAVHCLMCKILPGVRSRPGDPHAILVAPEYAAVLRRELLHLLGYRLIRWTHPEHLTRVGRIARALRGLVDAVVGVAAHAFRGGERHALPIERNSDWIARRRRLDLDPPRIARKQGSTP
ncbi:MAG: succinylglutamate desuccinylase/aspartoacylase family protein [Planctomycetota bacterium]